MNRISVLIDTYAIVNSDPLWAIPGRGRVLTYGFGFGVAPDAVESICDLADRRGRRFLEDALVISGRLSTETILGMANGMAKYNDDMWWGIMIDDGGPEVKMSEWQVRGCKWVGASNVGNVEEFLITVASTKVSVADKAFSRMRKHKERD